MPLTKSDKQDIEGILTKGLVRQEFKFENKLDDIEQKFEVRLTKFRDSFYTKIDPILKEVKASHEERVIAVTQYRRNQDRIETLEEIHPQGKHIFA